MYLLSNVILDQQCRFSHQDDTWLMARIDGSLRQKKWKIASVGSLVP